METRFEFVVPAPAAKQRLEDYLLDAFPTVSKMYLRELVKGERCEVNGRCENIGHKLRGNDLVEIWLDTTRGTAMIGEEMSLDILFEDEAIIVVNKPAGMLVHPSHREKRDTLLNGLVWHLSREGENVRPGLIHRLDKDTSGLLVVAITAHAHRILSRHFHNKRVEKRYVALLEGVVTHESGTIDAAIGRYPELKMWSTKDDGKHSITNFWVRSRSEDTTLVELEPVTGRTNQLRIHCELIGHPIVGDVQRGARKATRLYLHAARLAFPHPSTNERVSFERSAGFPVLNGSES